MRALWIIFAVTLLSDCTNRSFTPVVPDALEIGIPATVFAATSRARNPDGSYGFERSEKLQLLELTVSVPPSHTPGELKYAYSNPDPHTEFTMVHRDLFSGPEAFRARFGEELGNQPRQGREVTVFIHGYNATQAETAFRAAQLAYDMNLPGSLMIYSWPSKGKSLGYAYDFDSALFARDGLQELLFELKATGAKHITLVAHSMGSLVLMETLRQIELSKPGWVGHNIGGVLMISPDLDTALFRRQMQSLSLVPQPFIVFVSQKDSILNLSARLRGSGKSDRLGTISSNDQVTDLPIEIVDATAFAKDAESRHFVAGSSPALIAIINDAKRLQDTFEPGQALLGPRAARVDSFGERSTRITLLPGMDGTR